jgi:hypothetical protein
MFRALLCIILTAALSATARGVERQLPGQCALLGSFVDSVRPHTRLEWVPRDSNALWKTNGPDTGRIEIEMRPYGFFAGYLLSRDSNWVTLLTLQGQKVELRTSQVRGVNDWKEITDSLAHVLQIRKLPVHTRSPIWLPERFESLIAPMISVGATLPSNGGMSGVSLSASVYCGFRIPGLLYDYVGEFIGGSFESRAFLLKDNSYESDDYWNLQYLALTAGFSYRGIVSAGVEFGLPISSRFTWYNQASGNFAFGGVVALKPTAVQFLVEPKIDIGFPVSLSNAANGLILLLEAGYPLNRAFRELPLNNFADSPSPEAVMQLNSTRLPEISIGLTYVFPMFSQYLGLL